MVVGTSGSDRPSWVRASDPRSRATPAFGDPLLWHQAGRERLELGALVGAGEIDKLLRRVVANHGGVGDAAAPNGFVHPHGSLGHGS